MSETYLLPGMETESLPKTNTPWHLVWNNGADLPSFCQDRGKQYSTSAKQCVLFNDLH